MILKRRLIGLLIASTLAGTHAHAADEAASTAAVPPITEAAKTAAEISADIATFSSTNAAAKLGSPIMSDADLWHRIRMGFQLEPLDSQLVFEHEDWYSRRPDYIQRFVDRGSKYLHHIVEEVEKRGMPMEIALLPVIESAFNPVAYSRSHAAGMWQFIPSTGKSYGLSQNWWADHRRDVLASTNAALNYLQRLHGMFGNWELAIAAYNCGEGCVGRAIAKNQRKGLPTDFLSLDLPKETRNYVPKLIAVKNIVLSPGSYGIELDLLKDEPYFTTVKAPPKIDVKLAAKLAEMPEDEFVALNPAFTKPVAQTESGQFLLPIDKAGTFRENLENYDRPLVSWTTYSAKRGESMDSIAKRYGVSGGYLRAVNGKVKERKGKLAQPMLIMVPGGNNKGQFVKAVDTKPVAVASAAPTTIAPAQPANDTPATYKVKSGDSLYAISQRYDLDVEDIKTLNGMSSNKLAIGQVLKLTGAAQTPAAAATPQPIKVSTVQAPSAAAATTKFYTVKPGDTLFSISQRFGVTLDDLLRLNKLTQRSVIQPGKQVRISA
jgi:membrane-bound lytic murein transglycosylase D